MTSIMDNCCHAKAGPTDKARKLSENELRTNCKWKAQAGKQLKLPSWLGHYLTIDAWDWVQEPVRSQFLQVIIFQTIISPPTSITKGTWLVWKQHKCRILCIGRKLPKNAFGNVYAKYIFSAMKQKYNEYWLFNQCLFWKLVFHLERMDNI